MEEGLLKLQSLATLWKGHDYDENLLLTPHSTAICFPGSEVPKGFSFRKDIGKPSGSVNSDDEDEFWDSMEKSISSDDEDEFWESMEEPN
ncbi:hypothetical protein LWI29_004453 [Acer saccharum]|uniref:Uncharacterized protein n=1 Tax=Acer saccharum TaxID=4024 RepID=A0AA39TDA4_ACESA|nr:hypothetical protein LWI29_004453 [Acer saccharum]